MNIIYMHTHDSGRYFLPYGYQVPTPHIMTLAREAALFRHCYCAGPTCSPSRAALLTGTYPHCNGMLGLAHRGFSLSDPDIHLVNCLKQHNYDTALSGVQHEIAHAEIKRLGYDEDLTVPCNEGADRSDVLNADAAAAYIAGRRTKKPFFLSFGMFNTHRDYPRRTDIDPSYVMPPHVMYDTAGNRQDFADYMASARIADDCVGRILAAVAEAKLEDDTVILFTTDHGPAFPNMKCTLYDTGIGVALMIKYSGNRAKGKALDGLVSHLDVFPTLCDLCGLEKPKWLQGVSMVPLLNGETDSIRTEIYSEVTYHAAYEPMRCVRTERYKLIRRYDCHQDVVPANIDGGISKQFYLENGFLERTLPREMLFDLHLDPVERENLVNDPRYKDIYNDLSGRLSQWMQNTGDPLIGGLHRVSKPENAIVNKVSCIEPTQNDFEE